MQTEYDVIYSGALEREFIRSQQLPAPPLPKILQIPRDVEGVEHFKGLYGQVARWLSAQDGFVTINQLCHVIRAKRNNINEALTYFRRRGNVERMIDTPGRGRIAGVEQAYRWIR